MTLIKLNLQFTYLKRKSNMVQYWFPSLKRMHGNFCKLRNIGNLYGKDVGQHVLKSFLGQFRLFLSMGPVCIQRIIFRICMHFLYNKVVGILQILLIVKSKENQSYDKNPRGNFINVKLPWRIWETLII